MFDHPGVGLEGALERGEWSKLEDREVWAVSQGAGLEGS